MEDTIEQVEAQVAEIEQLRQSLLASAKHAKSQRLEQAAGKLLAAVSIGREWVDKARRELSEE